MRKGSLLWMLLTLATLPAAPARAQDALPSLVVSADSTLGLPLAYIVRAYARERQVAVALSLTGTESISNRNPEGSSADVLITANTARLAELKQQGLVDVYSETPIVVDHLALVGPDGLRLPVNFARGFPTGPLLLAAGHEPVFVLGFPQVLPEAEPSREALHKLGADADLEPYTVYLKDRRQMHDAVHNQRAFGIMLATDAVQHNMNILGMIPDNTHAPVDYRSVVLAGDNMDEARRFVEFLKSDEARSAFSQFGLSKP